MESRVFSSDAASAPDPLPGPLPGVERRVPPSVYVVRGLLVGVAAGVAVGALRSLHDAIFPVLMREVADLEGLGRAHWPQGLVSCGLWLAAWALVACLVGLLLCRYPQIGGSGIPHVESVLRGQSALRWWSTLWSKFAGTLPVLCAGLSVGREGPCIQLGATAGQGMALLWGQDSKGLSPLIAGAGAGLSAAFGAPLAGVILIFEEMRQPRSTSLVLQCLAASYTAWAVCRWGFGLPQVLPFNDFSGLLWNAPQQKVPALLCLMLLLGLLTGVAGVLYNTSLLALKDAFTRLPVPVWSKPLGGFLPAALLFSLCPLLLGGGEGIMIGLLEPQTLTAGLPWTRWAVAGWGGAGLPDALAAPVTLLLAVLAVLLVVKFLFSILSFSCGVPGGLLMPLLCLGALLGVLAGQTGLALQWLEPVQAREFLVLGMAGLFAGIVRAPLTGVALCVEMSGAWACLPGLLLVAWVAQCTANGLGSAPVYASLGKRFKPLEKDG